MSPSVLVVDDDEDDQKILLESLLQIGFRFPVHAVMSGAEALQFLETNRDNLPALIILDMNMPEMNGIKVLEKLKGINIPVIVYTTSCTDEVVKQVKNLGALDCIKKGTRYSDNLKFAKHVVQVLSALRAIPLIMLLTESVFRIR